MQVVSPEWRRLYDAIARICEEMSEDAHRTRKHENQVYFIHNIGNFEPTFGEIRSIFAVFVLDRSGDASKSDEVWLASVQGISYDE